MKGKRTDRISVTVLIPGRSAVALRLPAGSSAGYILTAVEFTRQPRVSILINGKPQGESRTLRSGDIVNPCFPIRGERKVQCAGRTWFIHKNDADRFPSDYHMHDYQADETLDLNKGLVYSGTRFDHKFYRLNEKHYLRILKDLRSSKDFREKAEVALGRLRPKTLSVTQGEP